MYADWGITQKMKELSHHKACGSFLQDFIPELTTASKDSALYFFTDGHLSATAQGVPE